MLARRGDGIAGGTGSTLSGNTAYLNGGDGISVLSGCTVVGNTIRSNTGFGLITTTALSGYRENVISSNTAGTVSGAGINLGNNLCNGVTTCP